MQTFSYQQLHVPPHPCSATHAEKELQRTRVCRSGGPLGALVPRMSNPRARGAVWRRAAITTGDSGYRHSPRDRPMEDAAFESGQPVGGRPRPGARVAGEYATAGEPTAPPRRPSPTRPPAPHNKATAQPRRPASAVGPEPAWGPQRCSLTLLHGSVPESTTLSGEFAAPSFHTNGEGTHLTPHGSSGEMAPTAAPRRRSQRLTPAQKASS